MKRFLFDAVLGITLFKVALSFQEANFRFIFEIGIQRNGIPFKEIHSVSRIICTTKCGLNKRCKYINYIEEIQNKDYLCQLFNFSVTKDDFAFEANQNSIYITEVEKLSQDCINRNSLITQPDGTYQLMLPNNGVFNAHCASNSYAEEKEGWLIIQRRSDLIENFNRTLFYYENGFGDLNHDFWLGLKIIHEITTKSPQKLRIDLWDGSIHKYAEYGTFRVGSAEENYKLTLSQYSGNAVDNLKSQNGIGFSTRDHDVDAHTTHNCAKMFGGGWWYKSCHPVSLNGVIVDLNVCDWKGMIWRGFTNSCSLSAARIGLKPHESI